MPPHPLFALAPLLFSALALSFCGGSAGSAGAPVRPVDDVPPPTDTLRLAYARQTAFALELHRALTASEPRANVFASPMSVWTALSLLAEGAEGETSTELLRGLLGDSGLGRGELRELARDLRTRLEAAGAEVEIAWADALWGERTFPFAAEVMAQLEQSYGARLARLDFRTAPEAARETANAWVAEVTRGRIRDLLPAGSVTPLTRLVLTDAVYFKGKWAQPFVAASTAPGPFRLAGGETVDVPFVQDLAGRSLPVASFDRRWELCDPSAQDEHAQAPALTVFELAYRGEALSMLVLVPDGPGTESGLQALERDLTPARLDQVVLGLAPRHARLALPKLELQPGYDLRGPLRDLGFARLFSEEQAELSGFVTAQDPELYVTGAFHKAFLRVDEEGTEAAAATGVVVGTRAAPLLPLEIRADRPFLFLIRERSSGAILFLGRVTDPRL